MRHVILEKCYRIFANRFSGSSVIKRTFCQLRKDNFYVTRL